MQAAGLKIISARTQTFCLPPRVGRGAFIGREQPDAASRCGTASASGIRLFIARRDRRRTRTAAATSHCISRTTHLFYVELTRRSLNSIDDVWYFAFDRPDSRGVGPSSMRARPHRLLATSATAYRAGTADSSPASPHRSATSRAASTTTATARSTSRSVACTA